MVRKSPDKTCEHKRDLFGGSGKVKVTSLLNGPEEMNAKGRVFAHTTLEPGAEIGFHIHDGDAETYYILEGTAAYNDNGTLCTLGEGDVAVTHAGEGHGIKNIGDGPLHLIALILYQ